ncbi:MAG TPA: M56 family metallopeptidase [Chitinophagaceae bacterium]|nr:M56 family metallopeptidase [Chitinophagaceae bacterium]
MSFIQTNFFQSLGIALLNSLWQFALLWVFYQLVTMLFGQIKARTRSSLATSLLIIGFGWFLFTFFEALLSNKPITEYSTSTIITGEPLATLTSGNITRLYPIAGFLYFFLLSIPLQQFIKNYRYAQALRQYGLSKINIDIRLFVEKKALQMGITRTVRIWISEFVSSPATIGFLKPIILVPLAAINHLSPSQIESLLLHELAHIKRNDYLQNLFVNIIKTILYFNPFAKAFSSIIEKEREISCDELVLQFDYNSKEYAAALLMLEQQQQQTFALAASGKTADLIYRVETILGLQQKKYFTTKKIVGITGGLVILMALSFIQESISGVTTGLGLNTSSPLSNSTFVVSGSQTETEKNNTAFIKPSSQSTSFTSSNLSGHNDLNYNKKSASSFLTVSFEEDNVPELKKYQEAQVKNAIEASRKILEKAEWEKVEKNIAEVLSEKEKEKLKDTYLKELNKFNWKQLENNLKIAYNKIDWEGINNQLNAAVTQIKTDSLRRVYNEAAIKLNQVQQQLLESNLKGIPDSDISLDLLNEKKQMVQRALEELKGSRQKKTVSL